MKNEKKILFGLALIFCNINGYAANAGSYEYAKKANVPCDFKQSEYETAQQKLRNCNCQVAPFSDTLEISGYCIK